MEKITDKIFVQICELEDLSNFKSYHLILIDDSEGYSLDEFITISYVIYKKKLY